MLVQHSISVSLQSPPYILPARAECIALPLSERLPAPSTSSPSLFLTREENRNFPSPVLLWESLCRLNCIVSFRYFYSEKLCRRGWRARGSAKLLVVLCQQFLLETEQRAWVQWIISTQEYGISVTQISEPSTESSSVGRRGRFLNFWQLSALFFNHILTGF